MNAKVRAQILQQPLRGADEVVDVGTQRDALKSLPRSLLGLCDREGVVASQFSQGTADFHRLTDSRLMLPIVAEVSLGQPHGESQINLAHETAVYSFDVQNLLR